MDASELLKKLVDFGADERGIRDRFGDDAELYAECFTEFLIEPNFSDLAQAVSDRDCRAAFEAAHALKGLSGNLGLLAINEKICAMVESLRIGSMEHAEAEYAAIDKELNRLKELSGASGESVDEKIISAPAAASKPTRKKDTLVHIAAALILLVLFGVGVIFCRLYINFRDNITIESAEHLIELNHQVKLYIENRIESDWKVLRSVGNQITEGETRSDEELMERIRRQTEIWNITCIQLYTESGCCARSDGSIEANDVASEMADKARQSGEYMEIVDSDIFYTIPVDSSLTYRGSRIVAVSVIQSMGTFLDELGFSSFGGKAWMYLTNQSGVVISRLTSSDTRIAYNFLTLTASGQLSPLSLGKTPPADISRVDEPSAYILSVASEKSYGHGFQAALLCQQFGAASAFDERGADNRIARPPDGQ